jgi:hypothetical protein
VQTSSQRSTEYNPKVLGIRPVFIHQVGRNLPVGFQHGQLFGAPTCLTSASALLSEYRGEK